MAVTSDKLLQQIAIEGDKAVIDALNRVGKAGEKTFGDVGKAADLIVSKFKGIGDKIESFTKSKTGLFGGLTSELSRLPGAVGVAAGAFGALVAAGVAVRGMFQGVAESAAKAADDIGDAAAQTGQSAKDFQEIGFAFRQTAKDGTNVELIFNSINDIISQAQAGGNETTKVFEKFGVKLIDSAGKARSARDILFDFAGALENVENKGDRAAAIISVFGRRIGGPLVALLGEGRKGLQEFVNDANRLNSVLTEAEIKVGDDFDKSTKRMNSAIDATRTKLGLLFAPAFTEGNNALANFIADNQERILSFGKILADVVKDITNAFSGNTDKIQSSFIFGMAKAIEVAATVIKTVAVPVFEGWAIILEKVIGFINQLFGTNFKVSDLAIIAGVIAAVKIMSVLFGIIQSIGIALGLFSSAATVAGASLLPIIAGVALIIAGLVLLYLALSKVDWAAFANRAKDAWNKVGEFFAGIGEWVSQKFGEFLKWINDAFTGLMTAAGKVWSAITGFISDAAQAMRDAWNTVIDWLGEKFDSILGWLSRLIARARSLAAIVGGAAKQAEGGAGFAGGGKLSGPGTQTSDSIPLWGSRDEWMIKAKAARYYGDRIMSAINNMAIPRSAFGFNGGGLVSALASGPQRTRFATGGPIGREGGGSSRTLNLAIDGVMFEGMSAPEDTAERLVKFAVNRQLRSAGRKPGWYGGKK